eukprot:986080-Rhodomonas_salina.1
MNSYPGRNFSSFATKLRDVLKASDCPITALEVDSNISCSVRTSENEPLARAERRKAWMASRAYRNKTTDARGDRCRHARPCLDLASLRHQESSRKGLSVSRMQMSSWQTHRSAGVPFRGLSWTWIGIMGSRSTTCLLERAGILHDSIHVSLYWHTE